jgi:hypothetical protein
MLVVVWGVGAIAFSFTFKDIQKQPGGIITWDRCYDLKILAFLTQNKAKLCKILIITLVFEKNANFFAENCQKSQKIVIIITSIVCDGN